MSNRKYEIEFTEIEVIINNKIKDFVKKYNQYPRYLKIPLWISNCMKQRMRKIVSCKIDYETGNLLYRNLMVCETIAIEKAEEIEVF